MPQIFNATPLLPVCIDIIRRQNQDKYVLYETFWILSQLAHGDKEQTKHLVNFKLKQNEEFLQLVDYYLLKLIVEDVVDL